MRKQRSVPYSRRGFLQAVGGAGIVVTAGCMTEGGAENSTTNRSTPISILAAGSLNNALLNGLEPVVDASVQIETHGSAQVARMIDEGLRDPDIVVVADTALFDGPLTPSWYSIFTSNAIVIAYNEETEEGQRLAASPDEWYTILASDEIALGRSDPKLDPLGYRALFMLELASRYYDTEDLASKLLQRDQIYPESSLISRFETGSVDAVIAYRNMAVERGYEFIDLPNQIDLSSPEHVDEWYSTVSYSLPNGKKVQGECISYGSTIRTMSDDALDVFNVLTTGAYLKQHGFILRETFPAHKGDTPQHVKKEVSSGDLFDSKNPTAMFQG